MAKKHTSALKRPYLHGQKTLCAKTVEKNQRSAANYPRYYYHSQRRLCLDRRFSMCFGDKGGYGDIPKLRFISFFTFLCVCKVSYLSNNFGHCKSSIFTHSA